MSKVEMTADQKLKQIDQAYSNACAVFGDLVLKKRAIDARLAQAESDIQKLNDAAARVKEQEQKRLAEEAGIGANQILTKESKPEDIGPVA